MIKRWCIAFGLWIARLGGWTPAVPPHILDLARTYVREQNERWPTRSGETKRAAVYRSLVNVYPKVTKRIISLAIEEAVCFEC